MKLHLIDIIGNGQFAKLACTNNMHTKGRTLTKDEFIQAIQDGKEVCSKCAKKV